MAGLEHKANSQHRYVPAWKTTMAALDFLAKLMSRMNHVIPCGRG